MRSLPIRLLTLGFGLVALAAVAASCNVPATGTIPAPEQGPPQISRVTPSGHFAISVNGSKF